MRSFRVAHHLQAEVCHTITSKNKRNVSENEFFMTNHPLQSDSSGSESKVANGLNAVQM